MGEVCGDCGLLVSQCHYSNGTAPEWHCANCGVVTHVIESPRWMPSSIRAIDPIIGPLSDYRAVEIGRLNCRIAELEDELEKAREREGKLREAMEPLRYRLTSGNEIPVTRITLKPDDCARLRVAMGIDQ